MAEYSLYRVGLTDCKKEAVSEHTTFEEGWSAATHAVTVKDTGNAYSLYACKRRVARFGHNRLVQQGGTV